MKHSSHAILKISPLAAEPNFETACGWWSDLPDIWTPIGWKDHMFRFNVFWNGMIFAQPSLNRRTEAYAADGVQAAFQPTWSGKTSRPEHLILRDDNSVDQGWTDDAAPVLWTQWPRDGVKLRQYVFAHVPGGRAVRTGVEPLFAWVRMGIHDLCPGLPQENKYGFILRLNAPHLSRCMHMRNNITFHAEKSKYPRELRPAIATSSLASPTPL